MKIFLSLILWILGWTRPNIYNRPIRGYCLTFNYYEFLVFHLYQKIYSIEIGDQQLYLNYEKMTLDLVPGNRDSINLKKIGYHIGCFFTILLLQSIICDISFTRSFIVTFFGILLTREFPHPNLDEWIR